jgi:predicted amidohydrolase
MNDPVLAIPYLVLWIAMMRAHLVRAQIPPATCNRCGRPYERRELGETVCSCARG